MTDGKLVRLRNHRNNIARYRRLLKTKLTELERQFIETRLSEEQSDLDRLQGSLQIGRLGGHITKEAKQSRTV